MIGHVTPVPSRRRSLADRPDHAPDELALPLLVGPRMEVVGDQCERETRPLGLAGVPDEVARAVLLRRERVTELHQGR